ncbi:zinc ribbon domain-containing protein [Christensenellaceae bacterium OttesenSCG-928-M15]|nr:zinc ribbon domain-containing protein [Christensenellaceae bacterium OttesenSCG-928-M15]
MENMHFCQSCAMPLNEENKGTNKDKSENADYCKYCYEDGAFTWNGTMEEMIDFCAPHMVEANPGMDEETAKAQMRGFFPQLKRWQSA